MTTPDPEITWRRTFPECKPGTDGVALADGRVIGRVRLMSELPASPKLWMWSVTDPELGRKSGWAPPLTGEVPSREEAMATLLARWRQIRASPLRKL